MVDYECHFCKKKYKTYPVIMNSSIEGFAFDQYIKDIFYCSKEDGHEKDTGVCKKCRDIHIYNNNIFRWHANFTIQLRLQVILCDIKKGTKEHKTYTDTLNRLKKEEKRLEKTKEVKAEMMKNAPYQFKQKPRKKKMCAYCGENYGQKWISNPNEGDKPTLKSCWWVCIPCDKIIDKQSESAFMDHVAHQMDKMKIPGGAKKARKRVKTLDKEIQEIAKEDGHKVFSIKLEKKEDGTYKSKRKY